MQRLLHHRWGWRPAGHLNVRKKVKIDTAAVGRNGKQRQSHLKLGAGRKFIRSVALHLVQVESSAELTPVGPSVYTVTVTAIFVEVSLILLSKTTVNNLKMFYNKSQVACIRDLQPVHLDFHAAGMLLDSEFFNSINKIYE